MPSSAEIVRQNSFDYSEEGQEAPMEVTRNDSVASSTSSSIGNCLPGLRERRLSRPHQDRVSEVGELNVNVESPPPSTNDASDSPVELRQETEYLFSNFMREEIENEGLPEPQGALPTPPLDERATPIGGFDGTFPAMEMERSNRQALFAEEGRRLRELADSFARSRERALVRAQAYSVNLNELNQAAFMDLLENLFSDRNVTLERIVLLFFYCRDLAIRALQAHIAQTFGNLVNWSITFILQRVGRWVLQHGGWDHVLLSSSAGRRSEYVVFAVAGVLTLLGVYLHFRRNG